MTSRILKDRKRSSGEWRKAVSRFSQRIEETGARPRSRPKKKRVKNRQTNLETTKLMSIIIFRRKRNNIIGAKLRVVSKTCEIIPGTRALIYRWRTRQ